MNHRTGNTHLPDGKVKVGDAFGALTVLEVNPERAKKWICSCKCGNRTEVYQTNLLRKKVVSCGCLRSTTQNVLPVTKKKRGQRRIDHTGKSYGWLTGVAIAGQTSSGNSVWIFSCVCGNEITRVARQVVRGDITSCGCKKKELLRAANLLPNNQSLKNAAYHTHQRAAEKRGITSYLSKEEYESIISQPCRYCGKFSIRKNAAGGEAELNSVDRLNNEPYYRLENSVPACFPHQKMKGALSEEEFWSLIESAHTYKKTQK